MISLHVLPVTAPLPPSYARSRPRSYQIHTLRMAGFVLGTGSGILAAAAVYYTLSVDLAQQTAALRGEYVRFRGPSLRMPHRLLAASPAHPAS
jgi:altered-inheritance-of-mitochondria protein 5